MKRLLVVGVLMVSGAGAQTVCRTLTPDAQDALAASPANHTVLFEDADVRVLDVHSAPHTKETPHTHRLPGVMYFVQQGAGTMNTPENPTGVSHAADPGFKPYAKAVAPQGLHWTENTGDVPFHAIRVEFKHPGCGLAGWKAAVPGPDDAVVAAPEVHTVLLETDDVRVLDVHLAAHAKEPMHTHPWPGFFYMVAVAPSIYSTPAGPQGPARIMPIARKILPVGAEGLHSVENVGDTPLHFIRLELKYGTAAPAP